MITETVATFAHLETEWDSEKLEKKILEYINKAGKELDMYKTLQEIIDDYTNNALSSMFASLGDREWLYAGGVDFSLVLMAGCKDAIPATLLNTVSQEEFEQMVLQAHAVRFEDQRFGPILTEVLANSEVTGPKMKKKVWNAFHEGRTKAFTSGATTVDDFMTEWIKATVMFMNEEWGGATSVLDEVMAAAFFHSMVKANALPIALTQEAGAGYPPEDWPLIEENISVVYAEAAAGTLERPPKKPKTKHSGW